MTEIARSHTKGEPIAPIVGPDTLISPVTDHQNRLETIESYLLSLEQRFRIVENRWYERLGKWLVRKYAEVRQWLAR